MEAAMQNYLIFEQRLGRQISLSKAGPCSNAYW